MFETNEILPLQSTTPMPAVATNKQPLFSLCPKLDPEFPIPILRFFTPAPSTFLKVRKMRAIGSGDTQDGLLSGNAVTQGSGAWVHPCSCFQWGPRPWTTLPLLVLSLSLGNCEVDWSTLGPHPRYSLLTLFPPLSFSPPGYYPEFT